MVALRCRVRRCVVVSLARVEAAVKLVRSRGMTVAEGIAVGVKVVASVVAVSVAGVIAVASGMDSVAAVKASRALVQRRVGSLIRQRLCSRR